MMLEAVSTAANIGPQTPAVLGPKKKRKKPVLMTDNDAIAYYMAEEIIRQLFEGGPGSGRHPGNGGQRMSIDQAQKAMGRMGMKIDLSAGSVKYDIASKTTSYIVIDKHGNRTRMNAKDIINLVHAKKKLKESFDPIQTFAESIIKNLFEGGPGSGNWGHTGRPGAKGGSLPTKVESILASILGR